MTIFFVDPEAGNDLNDGLSFATRKLTLKNACDAAALGDEIRLMASPDPTSVGAATWTDNSSTIAFSNTANRLVDSCDSGWVAAATGGITVTHPTTGRMAGSAMVKIDVPGAFTTGKLAYKALSSPLNMTTFQQLAFWFRISSTFAGTPGLKLAFCSDAAGDTIVEELPFTVDMSSGAYDISRPQLVDKGEEFTASGINSVALYQTTDPGSSTLSYYLDNLVLCKAPGHADLIDWFTLFGKKTVGEPEWYPIWAMDENGVTIGGCDPGTNTLTTNPPRPYRGVSETVTTYRLNPLRPPMATSNDFVITKGSQSVDGLTISGGWARGDMATKSGETWLSFRGKNYGVYLSSSEVSNQLSNIGICHSSATGFTGATTPTLGQLSKYDLLGLIACTTPATFSSTGTNEEGYCEFSCKQIWGALNAFNRGASAGYDNIGRIHGMHGTSAGRAAYQFTPDNCMYPRTVKVGKIDNNTVGVHVGTCGIISMRDTVMENNAKNFDGAMNYLRELHLHNMQDFFVNDATFLTLLSASNSNVTVFQSGIGGDPLKHRRTARGKTYMESGQAIRHTASGLSWMLRNRSGQFTQTKNKRQSHRYPLMTVWVEANKLAQVQVWMYIEAQPAHTQTEPTIIPDTRHGFGIMIEDNPSLGLQASFVDADKTLDDVWQQVTLEFTPTATGLLEIKGFMWGTTSVDHIVHFDDLTFGQVA